MISIIICSRNLELYQALSENVNNTIGCECELIRIDNSKGNYSIAAAYNYGAFLSKYPYLCFVHEDVKFLTREWGNKVIKHFEDDLDAGILGLAGGIYKAKMITSWAQYKTDDGEANRINIFQHYKFSKKKPVKKNVNPYNEMRAEVATLDGVLLITKKEIWTKNKFDENLLKGFHGYDLDFSLQVGRSKKLFVIYDIELEHFSEGKTNISWLFDMVKVHSKWKDFLPRICNDFSYDRKKLYKKNETFSYKKAVFLLQNNFSLLYVCRFFYFMMSLNEYNPGMRITVKKYFLYFFVLCKIFFEYSILKKSQWILFQRNI